MEVLSLELNQLTLSALESVNQPIQSSTKQRNYACATRLHSYMIQNGHPSLGNHLVAMVAQIGQLPDARQLLDNLIRRNHSSLNPLLKAYVDLGEPGRALILYNLVDEDGSICLNSQSFNILLKACVHLKDLQNGSSIHAGIERRRLLESGDVVLGNALVSMYVKCGSLTKAHEVFDNLLRRDVVSWNALIAGYAKQSNAPKALICFEQMQGDGIAPDAATYVCALIACSNLVGVEKGQQIHLEIDKKGMLLTDLCVCNALIDMYAKSGLLMEAQKIFDSTLARNLASYNSLIVGYVQHGYNEKALYCFKQMLLDSITPNGVTYVFSLKGCAKTKDLRKGHKIHTEITTKGFLERDLRVGNGLIDMYAECGFLADAQKVFDKLPVRDVVSWTSLITGYVEHGSGEEALKCFEQMKCDGTSPDSVIYTCILGFCGRIGAIEKGKEIHAEVSRKGILEGNIVIGNTLIDMYGRCGLLENALKVFHELPIRDTVSWNALIGSFAQHQCGEEALQIFSQMQCEGVEPDAVTYVCYLKACGTIGAIDKGQEIHAELLRNGFLDKNLHVGNSMVDMYAKCDYLDKAKEVLHYIPVRDVLSWNALISGYADHNCDEEVLSCFNVMQCEDISADATTYIFTLKSCGKLGAAQKGEEIHAEIFKKRYLSQDAGVRNALLDMYVKCGSLKKAQEVFDSLLVQDELSWTTLIAGNGQFGEYEVVFNLLDEMVDKGVKPNLITFTNVLTTCAHGGLVHKGQMYFEAMTKDYDIIPNLEHYTTMFDLFGRAGQLEEAVAVTNNMLIHPDPALWHAVLGACRKWRNLDLGREAFAHAMYLDDMDSSACVIMSDIYADFGMLERITEGGVCKPLALDPHVLNSERAKKVLI